MIGTIERLRRQMRRTQLLAVAPMMLIVVGPTHPDPIKHGPGKGGVLPIPSAPVAPTSAARMDSLLNGRRGARLERGRILYAPGHAPRDTAAASHTHKRVCPHAERVVAQTASAAGPNS
ncbi:MAG TPA: hypothetical protein VN706_09955 [Gemmatimonadaceae bacterium]|jgi:hypothetical protein|nr:hypothetical protein [Gemmatimonadaceae bacterium]